MTLNVKKKSCWFPWSQALHASPWWHSVIQWFSYCSQHSGPHSAHIVCSHMALFDTNRTHTLLIESSLAASDSGQFSGNSAWCFRIVHRQDRDELVPTNTPVGGIGLKQCLLTWGSEENHKYILWGCKTVMPQYSGIEHLCWGEIELLLLLLKVKSIQHIVLFIVNKYLTAWNISPFSEH